MAHRGVPVAGPWTLSEDIGTGIFFKEKTGTADQVEACDAAGEMPLGVIRYSQQDGQKSGDIVEGHYAGPPSEIIEAKAGAAIAANAEVMVNANGEAITATGTGKYVIGIAPRAVADNDIFELQVRPRQIA